MRWILQTMSTPLHIIILAAGDGTRMKSRMPKVLHPVAGRPMLNHVIDTAARLAPAAIHVVHNPDSAEQLRAAVGHDVNWVAQADRLGTGHAVIQAIPDIPGDARVLVLYGDTPLVPHSALQELLEAGADGLALLTMELADPTGYGRVLRDASGRVIGIVEQADASEDQRRISEVNSGILTAVASDLTRWLKALGNDNSQAEYYLTDIFALAHDEGADIGSATAGDAGLLAGANDRSQLAALERDYRRLAAAALMGQGVSIADPDRIDLRGNIEAGMDVWLDINVVLEGDMKLGDGVSIAPGCVLRDCELAAGTRVHAHSVLEGVRTTGACDIGPFARLRPGTVLAEGSRVGNFVEVKKTTLGEGSKASHLSYLGDSVVGRGVNIGAGTITCNYDGANKYQTIIADGAFIGSDSQLVAPVSVGENATVGAGTTLTRDAPAGQLTVSRSKQVTVKGWKRPNRKDQD
jgi:bifunctional UDP-N-acetylglucosamine pyrophosphorylase/glucosamine-1-phosphate N-acetyltransferase